MKLVPVETGDVLYPDVLVTCRPVMGDATAVRSVTVIVEILSSGTRDYDMEAKWESYRRIADLRHYAIIDPTVVDVVMRSRTAVPEEWGEIRLTTLDDSVSLAAIRIELPLSEIYDGIDAEMRRRTLPPFSSTRRVSP
jgi:Uma2 family endonuclease